MTKFLLSLLFLIGLGYFLYAFGIIQPYVDNYIYFSYCDQPIRYHVDTLDPKFNLSKQQFLADVDQAAKIWNKSVNRNLFLYDPDPSSLSINMIYDSRQSLETNISDLQGQLGNKQGPLNSEVQDYNRQSVDFENRLNQLNQEISDWNSKGGAPPDVYQQLLERQQSLQTESQRLNQTAKSLNQSTDQYNSQVEKLNTTINTFNTALTFKPENGIFKADQNRIEIYFNINQTELVHTLAHELGHTLSLPHNDDPKSIMYPSTTLTLIPSTSDISDLTKICQDRSIFEPFIQRLQPLFHP